MVNCFILLFYNIVLLINGVYIVILILLIGKVFGVY